MNDFQVLIKEICQELDIKLDIISNGWIYVFEKNGIKRFATMTSFDNNTNALGNIFADKYGTYALLKSINVPIIEHQLIYDQNNENDYAKDLNNWQLVHDYFFKHNNSIVLKANNGYGGKQVFHLTNNDEIDSCLKELFLHCNSISMCPYYEIKHEYRVFVLDNQVELIYKKIKPVVIGDGHKNIKELLLELNNHYFKDLNKQEYNRILEKGEVFEYNWQFNLSKGATLSLDITKNVKEELLKIVNLITNNIKIGFATIDLVELNNGKIMVMEINAGVGMNHFRKLAPNGYEISKKIYKKAIKKLLDLE